MKVILLQSVQKIGKKGDIVNVSDGYANNALFPNKKAIPASDKNLESLKRKNQSEAETKALQHGLLEQAILDLPKTGLEIKAKANEQGHLFYKIDEERIVSELLKNRISISEKSINLPEVIKSLGNYKIEIKEGSYKAQINLTVSKE
jgi:large subunit ribosomal protein L9